MRAAMVLLFTAVSAGCAYLPTDVSRVQLTSRDGGAVYYGSLRRDGLALISMTVEVERRTYLGNLELTSANTTFGLYQRYGERDAAPTAADSLAHTNFTKAVLSSSDKRVMTCDFTDVGGRNARGLCIDDAQRVYDVIFS